MEETMYAVSRSELLELLEAVYRLAALENGGVDNWQWYGDSLCDFLKEYKETNPEAIITDPEDEDYSDYDFDFIDVARYEIKNYEVIN